MFTLAFAQTAPAGQPLTGVPLESAAPAMPAEVALTPPGGVENFILDSFFNSTLTIQACMVVQILMSFVSWYFIFYKYFTLRRAMANIRGDFRDFREAKDLSTAMKSIGRDPGSSLYRIGASAVRELKRIENLDADRKVKSRLAKDNLRRNLRQGVNDEVTMFGAYVPPLGTIASISPLLGLFGTVWGVMNAFHAISAMQSAAITAIAPGMAEALVTTVIGLIGAIPASVAYNYFVSQLSTIETELVNFAGEFLNRIQRELPWVMDSGE